MSYYSDFARIILEITTNHMRGNQTGVESALVAYARVHSAVVGLEASILEMSIQAFQRMQILKSDAATYDQWLDSHIQVLGRLGCSTQTVCEFRGKAHQPNYEDARPAKKRRF